MKFRMHAGMEFRRTLNGERNDPEARIEQLESENAEIWHENMLLDAKFNEETAALWHEVMMGGMNG